MRSRVADRLGALAAAGAGVAEGSGRSRAGEALSERPGGGVAAANPVGGAATAVRSSDRRKRRDGSFEFRGHTGVEQGTRLRTAIEGVLGRKAKQDGRSPGQRRMDGLDELARRACRGQWENQQKGSRENP